MWGGIMEKNTLVFFVLTVLLVVAVVQAFQLTGLKTDLSGGSSTTTQSTPSTTQQAKLPSNLDNLPSMVGGC